MTSFDWENILPTEYWIEPYKEINNQLTRNYILYGKNFLLFTYIFVLLLITVITLE